MKLPEKLVCGERERGGELTVLAAGARRGGKEGFK
jgi:hypothetical protein